MWNHIQLFAKGLFECSRWHIDSESHELSSIYRMSGRTEIRWWMLSVRIFRYSHYVMSRRIICELWNTRNFSFKHWYGNKSSENDDELNQFCVYDSLNSQQACLGRRNQERVADPRNCAGFFECFYDRIIERNCNPGQLFDEFLGFCISSSAVRCGNRRTVDSISNSPSDINKLLPTDVR